MLVAVVGTVAERGEVLEVSKRACTWLWPGSGVPVMPKISNVLLTSLLAGVMVTVATGAKKGKKFLSEPDTPGNAEMIRLPMSSMGAISPRAIIESHLTRRR